MQYHKRFGTLTIHPVMKVSRGILTFLAISEMSRCLCSSIDIEANLNLQEESSSSNRDIESSAAEITIQFKAFIEPPETSFPSRTPTYNLPNTTSSGTGSTAAPLGLAFPSDWKPYASPMTMTNTPARISGWNSTLMAPTATRPVPSASQFFQSPNLSSFAGGASTTRESLASFQRFRLLVAAALLASSQSVL